jgi:hypothetical protein
MIVFRKGGYMKRIILSVFVLGISFMFSGTGEAFWEDLPYIGEDNPHYFTARAGAYFPTGDLDDIDFDSGFAGEFAYGYRINRFAAVELGVGYFQSETDNPVIDADFWSVPVTVSVIGILPLDPVEFYAGAAAGFYYGKIDFDKPFDLDENDTVFGGNARVGLQINLGDVAFVGAEGRFIFTDAMNLGQTLPQAHINGYIVTGHMGVRF